MTSRSPALAVLGISLMAGAAVLGSVLVHDGEAAPASDLGHTAAGRSVVVKGEPKPFVPSAPVRAWKAVLDLVGENRSYTMEDRDGGVTVVLTSPQAAPQGIVLAEGTVVYVAPHPDGSGRVLVVVGVHDWRQPILFR